MWKRVRAGAAGLLLAILLPWAPPARAQEADGEMGKTALEGEILRGLEAGADVRELLGRWQEAGGARSGRTGRTLPPRDKTAAGLNQAFDSLRQALEREPVDAARVRSAWEAFAAHDLLLRDELLRAAQALDNLGVGGEVRGRLEETRASYLAVSDRLSAALGEPSNQAKAAGSRLSPAALAEARAALNSPAVLAGLDAERPILRAAVLPYRRASLPVRAPVLTPAVAPSYLSATEVPSLAADLAPAVEAPLAGEILAKAEALGYDYARIYEFVQNEIATEWYAGSMKGALGTLRQGAGNDVDQASLLVALFRASKLPSRYVHGVLELPVEHFTAELGLADPNTIGDFLARSGVAHAPVVRGGRVAAFRVEATWVAAHVPYTNYRGAVVDLSGRTWLPLAPAIKTWSRMPATGVLRRMGLDVGAAVSSYLSDVQPLLPLDTLRAQVESFLRQEEPGETYAGQLGTRAISKRELGLLPNSLAVTVVAVTAESPVLADSRRHKVRLVARGGTADASPVLLDITLALSEVAGERLTLSYIPATADDHELVNLYGGLEQVPAYLVRLRPQVKVNGRLKAVAEQAIDMAVPHRFEVELSGPYGVERVSQTLLSGGYNAVAIGAQSFAAHVLPADDPADGEFQAARLLSGLAYGYGGRWDAAEAELAGLLDVAVTRPLPGVVIASNAVRAEIVLGLRQRLVWEGVTLDAALRVAEPVARTADTAARRDWMRLSALQGSALEHALFEEQFRVDALSADKALGIVRHAGGEVLTLDSGNTASLLPTLGHPQQVKADIENWTRLGMVVQVPRQLLLRNAWRGSAWRVEDPASGAAGYFLSGGLAGGATTEEPGNWLLEFLADALAGPFSPGPNLDPLAAASIAKIPGTDQQEGEVGKRFPGALSVMVRDDAGRPVKGAAVTFDLWAGNGTLIDAEGGRSPQLVVLTDGLGIASASLESGRHTEDNPFFVLKNEFDEFATRALMNLVEVSVSSARGTLAPEQPFEALAYPGAPHELRRTDRFTLSTLNNGQRVILGWAALWAGSIRAVVEDEFDNPISNENVVFSVGDHFFGPDCSPPAAFQDAVVFTQCSVTPPRLGDCGSPSVTVKSAFYGASAGVILGNALLVQQDIHIAAGGLETLTYRYQTNTFVPVPPFHCTALPGLLRLVVATPVGDDGQNIRAARAGQSTRDPLVMSLYYVQPEWDFDTSTPSSRNQMHWEPTTGNVQLTVDNGGAASPVVYRGNGRHESFITTGLTPASNVVTFAATNVRSIDLENGDFVEDFLDMEPRAIADVWGVLPKILGVSPDPVVLTDDGITAEPVQIGYRIEPPEYRAGFVTVDLKEDGTFIDQMVAGTLQGTGFVEIQRGVRFDKEKTYTAEMFVNPGGSIEVASDPFELPFFQRLIKSVQGGAVSQDVDVVNGRVCSRDSEFSYSLNQDAQVTLKIRRLEGQNTDGGFEYGLESRLINDELKAAGDHTLPLNPGNLPPGDWEFELTATSEADGHEETERGILSSEYASQDSLPVGHVMIKGVDLWDGHLAVGGTDFAVAGRGMPLELSRNYSSNSGKAPGLLGLGWSHNYESKIIVTPCGEVIVVGGEGSGMRFVDDGNGGLKPLKGYHGSLVFNQSDLSFDFYSKAGTRWHYTGLGGAAWSLSFVEDPNGNVTRLTYKPGDEEPILEAVEDPSGRRLTFTHEFRSFVLWKGNVVTSVTGPGGLAMTFEYDNHGNLLRAAREDDSRVELYAYDVVPDSGSEVRRTLVSVTNGLNGATTRYKYGTGAIGITQEITVNSLFVTELTEPEGGVTRFEYDVDALSERSGFEVVTKVTDGRGKTSTYTMDQYGSPLEVEDPLGHVTKSEWTPDDVLLARRTDANDVVTDFTYDADGNLRTETVQVTDFDGQQHTYVRENTYWPQTAFDPPYIKNRLKTVKDRNGAVRSYAYDERGNLIEETIDVRQAGGGSEANATRHAYAANGDRLSTRDARGNNTFFDYDAYGNVIKVTDPAGHESLATWNERSLQTSMTDARGNKTALEYDTLGRRTAVRHPKIGTVEAVEALAYDDVNNVQTATDPEGRATVTHVDRQGRVVRVENAAGAAKVYEYDAENNKTLESGWFDAETARVDVTYEYDAAGRLAKRTQPLGRVTTYEHDPLGNLVRETLAETSNPAFAPRVVETGYDALNRPIRVARAKEIGFFEVFTRYDGEGNKVLERDPLGRDTAFTYDQLNRVIERAEPESRTVRFVYDANGNLLRETLDNRIGTEARDQTRRFVYDALDRVVQGINAEGKVSTFEYDPNGNVVREVDPNGNASSHAYDERNRKTSSTRHLDRVTVPNRAVVTRFAYDRVGNLVETRQPNGNVVTQTFDALNRLTASTDSLGALSAATYDARGNRLTETDANGHVSFNHYDALNRLVRKDLPEDRTVLASYDVADNKTSETDARNNVRRFEYDRLNRLVKTIDPAPFNFTVELTYDAAGNKLTEKDRRGNVTTYEYDGLNRVTRVTGPAPSSLVATVTYDRAGNKLTETDRRGIVTTFAYDLENRLLRTVRDGLQIAEIVYDAAGNRIRTFDAKRNQVDLEYDERNLPVAEIASLGAVTRQALDDMGDSLRTVDPEGRTTTRTYDLRRRLKTEANGAGEITETTYDLKGNKTAVKRPKQMQWLFVYDDADRLEKVTDPEENVTTYGYDKNGNRTLQKNARDKSTTFLFDELNRVTTMTYPGGDHEEYGYDANGNRTRLLDAKDQEFLSDYDELNRESLRNYPGTGIPGTGIQSIASTYDANNNLLTVTETVQGGDTFVTTQTWDTFNRLTTVTDRYGKKLTYTYDANGNRASLKDPDGKLTTYAYDSLNRLSSVSVPEAGVTNYAYFKNGLLRQVTYPNGTTAAHTYDQANRVDRIDNKQGAVLVSSFAYAYDDNGNRTQQIETNGGAAETTTYTFDDADRLVQVVYPDKSIAYTYDANGNRLTEKERDLLGNLVSDKLFSYDDRDRLLTVANAVNPASGVTYTYDANGNQTSRLQAGVLNEFFFDVRDQMIEVRRDSLLLEAYAYDYRGLRVRKAGSGALLRYVYDDDSVLVQTDDFGNTIAKYDYGPDRLLSLTHATEGRQFYLFDALGSVANLMAPGGTLQARYQYDAWGNVRASAGTSWNPFGFTGHEMDRVTGLIYAKARFYDPETGRFLSEDAFAGMADNPPSLNKYLYAYGNPTIYIDPDGNIAILQSLRERIKKGKEAILELADEYSETDFAKTAVGRYVGTQVGVATGVLAGGAEIGNQLLGVANTVANVAVLTASSDSDLAQEAAVELEEQINDIKQTVKAIKEDPIGVGVNIVKAAGEKIEKTAVGLASGDPRAIAETTSTAVALAGDIVLGGKGAGAIKSAARTGLEVAESGLKAGVRLTAEAADNLGDAARALNRANKAREATQAAVKLEKAAAEGADLVQSARKAAPTECFVAGTLVATEHGLRPIEEIRTGDRVWARNAGSGEISLQEVAELFETPDREIRELELLHSDGTVDILGVTPEHPFWVVDEGWVGAGHLEPGDKIFTAKDGWLEVLQVRGSPERQTVYNFEVAEDHTYFVGTGWAWVHNQCEIKFSGKGRSHSGQGGSSINPEAPRNAHLEDLPIHERYDRFYARGSELLDDSNIRRRHPINEKQLSGAPDVGHGGVRNLPNEDLLRFGGPQGSDPIRGFREFQGGDTAPFPGSLIRIEGGHHRLSEIARRIRAGEIDPNTLIEFALGK